MNEQRYADAVPVHQRISQQAASHPSATALVFEDVELSYGELNARANRLAHRLIELGVKPEVRVGIALGRSIERVVSVLAVLKAGGAYVPLDPSYPAERLNYLMQDSGVALLLTTREWFGKLSDEGCALPAAHLLLDAPDWQALPAHDPAVAVHPEHAAYAIYTSGSTGRPKGVVVRHGALSNFLSSMHERPGLTAQDVLVSVTSLSFDIAGLELYLPLMAGARVVLANEAQARDGQELKTLLSRSGATVSAGHACRLAHAAVSRMGARGHGRHGRSEGPVRR